MLNLDENALVVKSNSLIEGRLPKGLTPREADLLTILFTSIKKDADNIASVRIRIGDLIKHFGLENSNSAYDDIAEISKRLMGRVVDVEDKINNRRIQYQWLTYADYARDEGFVEYRFNHELKPYLLHVAEFAKYILKPFLALDSLYAKRIYELLIQYKNMHRDMTGAWVRTIPIFDLRELLGITKEEYPRYDNFKARVLEIAKKQINERTDICFEYVEIRARKSVKEISFVVREQRQAQTALPPADEATEAPTGGANLARLLAHGVKEATARRLVAEHTPDVVGFNIDQLERNQKSAKATKIANPAGWLIDAIESDRGEQLSLFERKQREARATYEQKKARKDQLDALLNKIRQSHRKYQAEIIKAYISALYSEEERLLSRKLEAYLKEKNVSSILVQKTSNDRTFWYIEIGIRQEIIRFLSEVRDDFKILSISDFSAEKGVPNFNDLQAEQKALEQEL